MKQVIEKELKLSVPEGFVLPLLPGQPVGSRRFTSTYFDSKDFRLAMASITLRRRLENHKGLWQLKLPKEDGRLEVEEPGGPGGPPLAIRSLLYGVLRGAPLAPIAKIRTARSGLVAEFNGRKLAEVVLDKFQVMQDNSVVSSFQEVEIELMEGGHSDLKDLELVLRRAGAMPGDERPKVFQALDLPAPRQPKTPRDAPELVHIQQAISTQLDQILRHDPGTRLGSDPEDLHQLRVAVRRLRSYLAAAMPLLDPAWTAALRHELEWAGDFLNPLRDLDVMVPYFERELNLLEPLDAELLEPLLDQLRKEHETIREAMMAELASERYIVLLNSLYEATKSMYVRPAGPSLPKIASTNFRYLRKACSELSSEPTDDQLHRVRILTKRARFAAELAAGVTGKAADNFLEKAKQVQDVLGEHQDASVAESRIHAFAAGLSDPSAAFAGGRLAERQLARKIAARNDFPAALRALLRSGKKTWR